MPSKGESQEGRPKRPAQPPDAGRGALGGSGQDVRAGAAVNCGVDDSTRPPYSDPPPPMEPPMPTTLFSFVDLFARQVANARHLLGKGAAHAAAHGITEQEMLGWRLAEDM